MSLTGIASFVALSEMLEQQVVDGMVEATADAHGALASRIPRKSNRAASSFFPSVNTPSTEVPSEPFRPLSRQEVVERVRAANPKPGDTILLTSNIPYVPNIEKRRPFVQAALAETAVKLGSKE